MKPVLLIIAGPNGSGKTTVTVRLKRDNWSDGIEYLNPDDIARDQFGDWNSESAVKQAARWTTARRNQLLAEKRSLAFETVFSADEKLSFVRAAKQGGYFVRLFFIGTSSPEINASRVARRVMEGGHDVPIPKIISRYSGSLANLSLVLPVIDRAYIYDNSISGVEARLVARTIDGKLRKTYGDTPQWIADILESTPRHDEFEAVAASG